MILFFEHGRIGNQLFQYCGLRHYFPKHKLVFVGFEDLQSHFDNVKVRFIPRSAFGNWFSFGILRRIVFFLVAARVLGRITEEKYSDSFKLCVRKGLLWNILVPQNVFFQHSDFVDQIRETPTLKPALIQSAHEWLRKKQIDPNSNSLVFIHIRRTDYLFWPSREFPAVLDLAWYKSAMDLMQVKIKKTIFILMSDDQYYVNDVFGESDRLVISDNLSEIDMAIMSLCHSGILSASSFAWWGMIYARSNQKMNATFLAPTYWLGHRDKKWNPTNFRTNWITYVE